MRGPCRPFQLDGQLGVVEVVIAEVEGGADQRPGGRVDVIDVRGPDLHRSDRPFAGGVAELDDLDERNRLAG